MLRNIKSVVCNFDLNILNRCWTTNPKEYEDTKRNKYTDQLKKKKQIEPCSFVEGKIEFSSVFMEKTSNISFSREAKGIDPLDTTFQRDSSGDLRNCGVGIWLSFKPSTTIGKFLAFSFRIMTF